MLWIIQFFIFTAIGSLLLRRNSGSRASKIAFTWLGPLPTTGESWTSFQFRWAKFSFSFVAIFSAVFSLLGFYAWAFPSPDAPTVFFVLGFASAIGFGMAIVSSLFFSFKALKAIWFGPNPVLSDALKNEQNA